LEDGNLFLYGFRVDEPIPTLRIPLWGSDVVELDFDIVYQHTFNTNPVYGLRFVDYAQRPERFETYDDEDRQRIQAVMKRAEEKYKGT
jgi:hypothetical protein